jgi:hypothetical protein
MLGKSDVNGSPQPGTEMGSTYTLDAGQTYSVVVDAPAGYSYAIGGDCAPNGNVGLIEGQNRTCTVTAQDADSTLTVATGVVNDNGGTRQPGDITAHVRAGANDVDGSPQPGSSRGTPYELPAGSYSVAAGAATGYSFAYSGACGPDGAVNLTLGQSATCTITANDVAPTLTVVTSVVNDHAGMALPDSFSVHVRLGGSDAAGSPRPGSSAGTTYTLDANAYSVSADPIAGYGLAVAGDCAGDGSITLSVGNNRTCTITANDDPPAVRTQSSQLPPPQPGRNVNAQPKSGTVKVKLPGSAAYVDLDEAQQLPVGTVIDARNGHVTLVAAADDSGGTATAEFWAGIFRLWQTKGTAPTTVLTLVEKLSCPRSGKASIAAKKKKKKRRLWGDGSGKFQTKGKHSAATVVGTRWLVEDRCDSTLTRVVRGRVSVRDFVKKKTVTVRAGKKYIARAKKK